MEWIYNYILITFLTVHLANRSLQVPLDNFLCEDIPSNILRSLLKEKCKIYTVCSRKGKTEYNCFRDSNYDEIESCLICDVDDLKSIKTKSQNSVRFGGDVSGRLNVKSGILGKKNAKVNIGANVDFQHDTFQKVSPKLSSGLELAGNFGIKSNGRENGRMENVLNKKHSVEGNAKENVTHVDNLY